MFSRQLFCVVFLFTASVAVMSTEDSTRGARDIGETPDRPGGAQLTVGKEELGLG